MRQNNAEKKRISIGGIICLVLAALMFGLFLTALKSEDMRDKLMKEAVYVGTEASAENEGKLVVMNGTLSLDKPAYDPEYGLTIDSPRASRHVQQLTEHKDSDSKRYVTQWDVRGTEYFVAEASVNGLKLSEEIVKSIMMGKIYADFDPNELQAAGLAYFTDDSTTQRHYVAYADIIGNWWVGDERMFYSCTSMRDGSPVTVVGLQRGDELVMPEKYTGEAVFEGELDLEGVLKDLKNTSKAGSILMAVLTLVFAVIGLKKVFG